MTDPRLATRDRLTVIIVLVGLLLSLSIGVRAAGATPMMSIPPAGDSYDDTASQRVLALAEPQLDSSTTRPLTAGDGSVETFDSRHRGMLSPDDLRFATEAESGLVTATETCNSFERDTDVLMADGTKKAIDQVKVGDIVTPTDPQTGKTGQHRVTALIRHKTDRTIVDVKIRGEHGAETIAATDHHPFYVTDDGGRWVDAGDLYVGDHLRSPDATTRTITGVATRTEHETVMREYWCCRFRVF